MILDQIKRTLFILTLTTGSTTVSAADQPNKTRLNAGKIFVEALSEGAEETICGTQERIRELILSSENRLKNIGYACLASKQTEKTKERIRTVAEKKEGRGDSRCWLVNGVLKCKVWFPETTINGIVEPAGYREVEQISDNK